MVLLTCYFQLHQPFRLHPDSNRFLWDEENKRFFQQVAEKNYIPATKMFTELIRNHSDFKITMSISGTLLEQAQLWGTGNLDVIGALRELYATGKANKQVEFLAETYYHSVAGLFADKQEFREQLEIHRELINEMFDVSPTSFRNTELIYNNDIAEVVVDMGFKSMLCEHRQDTCDIDKLYRATSGQLYVIPRNNELSDRIACDFNKAPTVGEYAASIARIGGQIAMLGYDFEHIGAHILKEKGIFDYWRNLPTELEKHGTIIMVNPSEVPEFFTQAKLPTIDVPYESTSSWADKQKDASAWIGNEEQLRLFRFIEFLGSIVKDQTKFLPKWRHLTTSDHLYYICDMDTHLYFNAYQSPELAERVLTQKVNSLFTEATGYHMGS